MGGPARARAGGRGAGAGAGPRAGRRGAVMGGAGAALAAALGGRPARAADAGGLSPAEVARLRGAAPAAAPAPPPAAEATAAPAVAPAGAPLEGPAAPAPAAVAEAPGAAGPQPPAAAPAPAAPAPAAPEAAPPEEMRRFEVPEVDPPAAAAPAPAAPAPAATEPAPPEQIRRLEVPEVEPPPAAGPSPTAGQYAAPLDSGDTGAGDGEGRTLVLGLASVDQLDDQQLKVFEYNRRIQAQNKAPPGFPVFARDGFDMRVFCDGYERDADDLIYKDFVVGVGASPKDGQQATFTYTAYNESGAKIDSSFKEGKPAVTQLGTRGMIPGFELALKGMRPGGRRRVIVVPALGPPVGPQTFFSAKQHEVFDIELLEVKDCRRVGFGFGFGSNLVCE